MKKYNSDAGNFIPYWSLKGLSPVKSKTVGKKFTAISSFLGDINDEVIDIVQPIVIPSTTKPESADYSKDYLTFKTLADSTFTFDYPDTSPSGKYLEYSLDNGETWIEIGDGVETQTVESGKTIMWRATELEPRDLNGIGKFNSTGYFNAYGNIMSLYYGDDFVGKNDLSLISEFYTFDGLFAECSNIVNAENIVLPATKLVPFCYESMFSGCTSLKTAPELPSTELADNCYQYMFGGCSSLFNAPELPATTLVNGCYRSMFIDCNSLAYIKCLANNFDEINYTQNWVQNVQPGGKFIKNASAEWFTGESGIPEGWDIVDA